MIIATAGHIDHGKTALIRALTGIDTDRLPEERARGISIDLGFAHSDLDAGVRVSFVDVPGHERFVRNMLAGVGAIDAAMLIVAADDGVMPQTLEHLCILDLLDVQAACVVITKTDLVDAARVDAVAAQVRAALAPTSLRDAPCFRVCSVRRTGMEALRQWIAALAAHAPARPPRPGQLFRMPVDRSFSVTGSGTVVTGTVHAAAVAVGDRLMVSPQGIEVRVRKIHVQDCVADSAQAGQRCALNLVGVGADALGRGDWIVHPFCHAPSERIDTRLKLLASEAEPLRHWSAVLLHLGTACVAARVILPAQGCVAPGESGFVQFRTERPLVAAHADRFVIRDQGARRTLGGGVVLDPHAAKLRRGVSLRDAQLLLFEQPSAEKTLAGLAQLRAEGVDLDAFARRMNLDSAAMQAAQHGADLVVLGKQPPVGVPRAAVQALTVRVLAELGGFHQQHPQEPGIALARLRKTLAPKLPLQAFQAYARGLANRQLVVLSNDVLALKDHETTSNAADEQLWMRVQGALERAGVHVPVLSALAQTLSMKEAPLRDFLHRKSRSGALWRIAPDRFALRSTLLRVAAAASDLGQRAPDGFFVAADLRDALGSGRALAIHYLEFFDKLTITQRFGDRRRMGRDFAAALGAPAGQAPAPARDH